MRDYANMCRLHDEMKFFLDGLVQYEAVFGSKKTEDFSRIVKKQEEALESLKTRTTTLDPEVRRDTQRLLQSRILSDMEGRLRVFDGEEKHGSGSTETTRFLKSFIGFMGGLVDESE
jgi:hypothetical protein